MLPSSEGRVRILEKPEEGDKFQKGDVLVTGMTNPDWGPVMERASAIVTNHGGRTAHAAIVSRELGIPAIVGTERATEVRKQITELTIGYDDKRDYFIDHLAQGMARIAASQYPNPVLVRMSDFKTNGYAGLIGGAPFEPKEENPMLGFRGASRYYSERYREAFSMECRAIRRVREKIGLKNVKVMIPFCRTIEEADKVIAALEETGLKQGKAELELYVMAEVPSNIFLANSFADRFDGFSIGSNDLTQLILGIDR